jgi:hypothetical protein
MSTLDIPARKTTPIREKLEKQLDDGTWGVPDFTGATPHLSIWDENSGELLFDKDGTFESPASTGIATVTPLTGDFPDPADPFEPIEAGRQWRVTYADLSEDYFPPQGTKNKTKIWRTLDSE